MTTQIETRSGRIQGTLADGLHVFRGIPYARPPLGPRRFRAPEPEDPWAGVRDATRPGPSAPQRAMQIPIMPLDIGPQDEDCLYLNVWTPRVGGAGLPVLVWIHGGAFTMGSGAQSIYEASRLARRGDVVVVTINYRLGALGFLHLADLLGDEYAGSGNLGILDQVAALAWVRDNIAAFGGDPRNVTIFGESAGGMSVGTLLGTPAARGLFARAIPQSGAAHNAHSREVAVELAERMLAALGLSRDEAGRLRELSPERLLQGQDQVSLAWIVRSGGLAFQPVVDGAVLPQRPIDAVRDGLSREVDVLVGATRDEWNLFGLMDPALSALDEAGLARRLERALGERAGQLVEAYRNARSGRLPTDPRSLFLAIESDRVFRIPAVRLAEAQSGHGAGVYKYLFTWESPFLGDALGACHGIDVPFVFGHVDLPGSDKFVGSGPGVRVLADSTMDAWLGFAREGDPGHAALGAWPAYETTRRSTMLLGPACAIEEDPFGAERRAWDGIL